MDQKIESDLESQLSNDDGEVVIGQGVTLEGKIDSAKNTNISGVYNGSINSDSLYVTKEGKLKGDIKTQDITISGNFTGDVFAEKSIIITDTGIAKGNFEYGTLEVKFGATIEGLVKYSGSMSTFSQAESDYEKNETLSQTENLDTNRDGSY